MGWGKSPSGREIGHFVGGFLLGVGNQTRGIFDY